MLGGGTGELLGVVGSHEGDVAEDVEVGVITWGGGAGGTLKRGRPQKTPPSPPKDLQFWQLPLLGLTQSQSPSPPWNSYSLPVSQGFPPNLGFKDVPHVERWTPEPKWPQIPRKFIPKPTALPPLTETNSK